MKKLSLSLLAVLCTWAFIQIAYSAPGPPMNVTEEGIALKGYDPVAYFTQSRPVRGQKEFQHDWNNAKWFFSSREHLHMFQENPDKFAPQYGGY